MSKLGNCVAKWPVSLRSSHHTEPWENIKVNIGANMEYE